MTDLADSFQEGGSWLMMSLNDGSRSCIYREPGEVGVPVNEELGRRPLQEVHVLQQPGIYRVSSTSETAYLVDSRAGEEGLLFCRQRGTTASRRGEHDNRWHALVVLKCLPELDESGARLEDAIEEAEPFVLRVGRRHYYVGETTFDVFWWLQRACTSIQLMTEEVESDIADPLC